MLLFLTALVLPLYVKAAPEIQFPFGKVRGEDKQAQGTGRLYYTYHGIPYAEPPVGGRRFKPPVPFRGFDPNVVLTSDGVPAACIQPENDELEPFSEDCLFLSVYAPPSNTTKKVMIYIHGGGFTEGSVRIYVPGRLVTDYDVIVVNVQYRLGVLGWLSSGDCFFPGNLGLRDQLMAIKWVKDNIARFRGDPNDITIFGESAGGVSVSTLILSPYSKGLFNKAAMQSGSITTFWGETESTDHREYLYKFAELVGCAPRFFFPGARRMYHEKILACLMRKEASELTREPPSDVMEILSKGLFAESGIGPVVDGDTVPKSPYAMIADEDYLRANGVLDRSYVIGVNNNEGLLLAQMMYAYGLPQEDLAKPSNVASQIRYMAGLNFHTVPSRDMLNAMDFVYTFPRNPDGSIPYQKIIDISSDIGFVLPAIVLARGLADKAPVYFSLFDHYPQLKDPNSQILGTSHAMDLFYLFDYPQELNEYLSFYANVYTTESEPVPAVYRGALTSFAKTGAPTYPTNPSVSASSPVATWPRYDLRRQQYLAMSARPEVRREVYAQRVSLWLDFLPKLSSSRSFWSRGVRAAYS